MSDASAAEDARTACPNCGAAKRGRFCAACGQNDRNYRRSVVPVVAEVLAETFEADSRLWRTTGVLFARPGFLAQEFSRNRRARYLSPFRLYLFTSIAFFFVLALNVDLPAPSDRPAADGTRDDAPGARGGRMRGALPAPLRALRDLDDDDEEEDDEDRDTGDGKDSRRVRLSINERDPETEQANIAKLKELVGPVSGQQIDEIMLRERSPARQVLIASAAGLASVDADAADDEGDDDLARLVYLIEQGISILHRPADAVQQFVDYLPVAMFVLLPLYAVLLKLMYLGRRRFYSEHLVFAMHIHTVAYFAFAVAVVTPDGWIEWLDAALWLGLMLYYYLALKRYYGDGAIRTFFKWVLLLWLYSALLVVTMLATAGAVLLLF